MVINQYHLQPGVCPFCGKPLSKWEMTEDAMIEIALNNGSVMPQPVCQDDRYLLGTIEGRVTLFAAIKTLWISEIKESTILDFDAKVNEIERISKLEVDYETQR